MVWCGVLFGLICHMVLHRCKARVYTQDSPYLTINGIVTCLKYKRFHRNRALGPNMFTKCHFSPGAEYMNMLVVWEIGIIGIEVRWGGGGIASPPEMLIGEKDAVVLKSMMDQVTSLQFLKKFFI